MVKHATGPAVTCPCLSDSKGGKAKMVMPEVVLVDPAPKAVTLQVIDPITGNPHPLDPADVVTGTLTSDNEAVFSVVQDADTLHYTATIPANTPLGSVANLAATVNGTIGGNPQNLTASVKVTINIPPASQPLDLQILIA